MVSRAIDLNDQLQKVLAKHDTLLSVRPNSTANLFNHEEVDDEEEAEQLFRRYFCALLYQSNPPWKQPTFLFPEIVT